MARASVATVLLKLPPLSREALAKLAGDPTLKKYSPDQPRDERGRWTSGDGDDAAAFAGDGERAGASSASAKPVQVADAGNQMSDAGGILPAHSGDRQSTKIPPPAGTGAVREYSPEEAAKLPPPPPGSKYVALNDGSVLWTEPFRSIKGGPMLMPDDVSLATNARIGQALNDLNARAAVKDTVMVALFARDLGAMDYQRIYCKDGEHINRDYIDIGNYNYGVVAAAAGYSFDHAIRAAGRVNESGEGDKSGPHNNNPRNLAMIKKGYDDYFAGRIIPLPKN